MHARKDTHSIWLIHRCEHRFNVTSSSKKIATAQAVTVTLVAATGAGGGAVVAAAVSTAMATRITKALAPTHDC